MNGRCCWKGVRGLIQLFHLEGWELGLVNWLGRRNRLEVGPDVELRGVRLICIICGWTKKRRLTKAEITPCQGHSWRIKVGRRIRSCMKSESVLELSVARHLQELDRLGNRTYRSTILCNLSICRNIKPCWNLKMFHVRRVRHETVGPRVIVVVSQNGVAPTLLRQ